MELVISALEKQVKIEEQKLKKLEIMLSLSAPNSTDEVFPEVIPGYLEQLKDALKILVVHNEIINLISIDVENRGFQLGYMKRVTEEKLK